MFSRAMPCALALAALGGSLALGAPSGDTEAGPRVISLAPCITETLFALGLGDCVVGRTDFCQWPEEALAIPSVGAFVTTDWERIFALDADLAIYFDGQQDIYAPLSTMGIEGLGLPFDRVNEAEQSTLRIAERLGVSEAGERLVAGIRASVEAVASRLEGVERRRVLLLVGREPNAFQNLYAAGPDCFLHELLECAGGENVMASALAPFPNISVETLLWSDPDVIIDTALQLSDPTSAEIQTQLDLYREQLGDLKAVRDERVVLWTDPHLTIPGPGMGAQVARLAAAIHPEVFD